MNRYLSSAATVAIAAMLSTGASAAGTFNNGSFESGDLTGWTQGGGFWFTPAGGYPVPNDYLPTGSAYDASGTAITITTAGFDPLTDGNLRTVYAGNHSAQVNNSINNDSVSVLSQRVNGYSSNIIAFAYAAVLESSHGPTDSGAFIITLTDLTTSEEIFSFNLNSATAVGVFTQSSQGWFYSDWIEQSVDVSTRIGHDFVLSLLANDCPYGGHAGYAYLDGFGSVIGGGGTGGGAPTVYWDFGDAANVNNGAVDGGDGTWAFVDTTFTDSSGATNAVYATPANVIFSATPGTVTVDNAGGQVQAAGLSFVVDGYVLTGDAIELTGGNANINVGDGTPEAVDMTATIEADLIGSVNVAKLGAGTLVLEGDNSFIDLNIGEGTVAVGSDTSAGTGVITIANDATLAAGGPDVVLANDIVTQGDGFIDAGPAANVFTLDGDISGPGSITTTGAGKLVTNGVNTYIGPTTVAVGTLIVNGTALTTATTVNSGATIGGNGSVGSLDVLAGGHVAPGNSIGTLTVVGPYTQAAGGIYDVELTNPNLGDLIDVDGTATLATGAIANVINFGTTPFALGSRWTILSASDGLTGTFTLTGATQVSQFIDVFATYDANNAYLNVAQTSSFASAGNTINQINSATGSDRPANGTLYQAIAYLPDKASAQNAFDQTSGEIHASLRGVSFEDSRFVREAVYNHTAQAVDPRIGFWVSGFGSWGNINSDGNAAQVDRSIAGFFLGVDALKSETLSLGVLTGYSTANVNVYDRGSHASTDDLYVGIYGSYDIGGFNLTGAVTNTWRWVGTRRDINFQGFQDSTSADYLINMFQVFGEGGYQFRFSGVGVEPFASFAYVSVKADNFAEFGGAAALLADNNVSDDFWTTLLGVKLSYGLPIKGDTFSLTASGGWRYVFEGDVFTPTTLRFNSGPAFEVYGAPIAQNAFAAAFTIQAKLTDRADADIGYSGQYGDGFYDSGVRAALRIRF